MIAETVASDAGSTKSHVSIHSLPEEILEYIFSFLSIPQRIQAERVCKRWQVIGKTWHFPSKLALEDRRSKNTDDICGYIYFSLINSVTDKVVDAILSRCGSCLKELTIRCCNVVEPWVSEKTLQTVARHCPTLVEVRLHAVPLNNGIRVLVQGCEHVKSVTLRRYSSLTDEDMLIVINGWKSLECLDVFASLNYVTGTCFQSISEGLRVLRLRASDQLQAFAVQSLTSRCRNIEELYLPCCDMIQPSDLSKLLCHFKDTLKILNLSFYTNDLSLCKGIQALHRLQELDVNNCWSVNDTFCRALTRSCPNLTKLNLSNTLISDIGLFHISSILLAELDVSNTGISGKGISTLAEKGRLEVLIARRNKNVSPQNQCFYSVIQNCSNLSILDVRCAQSISSAFLDACCECVKNGTLKRPVTVVVDKSVSEKMQLCDGKLNICNLLLRDVDLSYRFC